MPPHPNEVLVRSLFAAFAGGDVGKIRALVPEHAVWHFPGVAGRLAGRHEGREAIFRFLLDVQRLTAGSFHLELEDVVAGDRFAAAFFRGTAKRGEETLDNPTCLKIRFEAGRIAEVHEFVWDLGHVERFWA